jgi:hypothetical protein
MQWPTVCFANFKLWRFSVPFHWHPAHVAHTITKVLNPLRKTIQIAGLVPAGPRSTFHDPVVNLDLHAFYAPVSFVDAEMGFSSQDWWRRGGILKGWNLPRPDSSRKLISAWSTKLIAALSERLCSETRVLDFFFFKKETSYRCTEMCYPSASKKTPDTDIVVHSWLRNMQVRPSTSHGVRYISSAAMILYFANEAWMNLGLKLWNTAWSMDWSQ